MTTTTDYALLIGRLLLAAIFLWSGISKIMGYSATAAYMDKAGVPSALLPLVIVVELAGGIAVLVGWQTRWAALVLAGFTLVAALLFHLQPNDRNQMIRFMKNIAMVGGFLALYAAGAGRLSLDARIGTAGFASRRDAENMTPSP